MLLTTVTYQQEPSPYWMVVIFGIIVIGIIVAVVRIEKDHAQDVLNHVKVQHEKAELRRQKEQQAADSEFFDKVEEYRSDFH